jgi:minor extracellular serine protease Vpr
MKMMNAALAAGLLAAGVSAAEAAPVPVKVGQRMARPVVRSRGLQRDALLGRQGRQLVSVRLKGLAGAELKPLGSKGVATVRAEQEAFLARCLRMKGVRYVARTQHVLNAVFLEVDVAAVPQLLEDPAVQRVTPVGNYALDLLETVPYVGGAGVHGLGIDGTGIRVAVIDSGVDYHHASLGGSGDPADWALDDPSVVEPGSFPTAKVVGGYDFVGSDWPNSQEAPDADPLDDGPGGGHGTHVADIIGGVNGVAPGVELYAFKACSSVSSSCSGVALIQAMDRAVDVNADGDTSDAVDIINMSLGSNYGQPFDDDLALAVENATALGVLTVASAGNGGDHPYITGTPAAAGSALSVAQTAVPSAALDLMQVDLPASAAGQYVAVHQPWSPFPSAPISGPVQYGDGAGGNLNGCAPFAPGSLSGLIVVVDRGACAFSDKIRNIGDGGGALGVIGLVAAGEPFAGGFGGGAQPSVPGFMISQADANILRAGGAAVTFDPNNRLPLAGSVVSTSSRGPRNGDTRLKPDIGAPGASVSAEYGTGTGNTAFGGTSGAAPMVSGAAALVLESRPYLDPLEIKAFLMNYAETQVAQDFTGRVAPVSRVGAGELRVDAAVNGVMIAFERESWAPSISGLYVPASKASTVIKRSLRVRNYTGRTRRVNVSWSHRDPSNPNNAAISVQAPASVTVGPHTDKIINVKLTIDATLLPDSGMTSGDLGNDPAWLDAAELSGFLHFDDGHEPFDVPFHVLPRKASDVTGNVFLGFRSDGTARVNLRNRGVGTAQNEVFGLAAVSADLPAASPGTQSPTPDLRAVGVATYPVPAGFCSGQDSFLWRFAFNTWEPQTHLLPVILFADLDIDGDGSFDYEVINGDLAILTGAGGIDGRSVSIAFDLNNGGASAFFYAEHATNTGNTVVTVCAEQVGLTGTDLGTTPVTALFGTFDYYFGGPGDVAAPVTITPGGERYIAPTLGNIPGNGTARMDVTDTGSAGFPDLGLLLITNSDQGVTARGGSTPDTEALVFKAPNGSFPF